VPGVIKLRNGEYTSLKLDLDVEKTLEIRCSIIHHTAEIFEPTSSWSTRSL
jgi:predicted glycosyltransferase